MGENEETAINNQGPVEEGRGVVGLMVDTALIGENIGLLSQFDHTGDENRRIASDKEVDLAQESLARLLEFLQSDTSPEHKEVRERTISEFQATLTGFNYRQEHRLPGLRTQFLEIRKQIVSGENFANQLTALASQPDAADIVQQLKKEYETLEKVLGEGGEPDLDKLENQVLTTNQGLDSTSLPETIGRWRALQDLRAKLAGSKDMANIQGRPELITKLETKVKEFKSALALQAANNLSNVVDRLQTNGQLPNDEHEGSEYAATVAAARKEQKGVEFLPKALKRANQLIGRDKESSLQPISLEKTTVKLQSLASQETVLQGSLEESRQKEKTWSWVPIISIPIKAEQERITNELITLGKQRKQLVASLELAATYNTLLDFHHSLVETEEPKEKTSSISL